MNKQLLVDGPLLATKRTRMVIDGHQRSLTTQKEKDKQLIVDVLSLLAASRG